LYSSVSFWRANRNKGEHVELFVTKNSPYARIVRVVTYELGIEESVTFSHAKTRKADSPYYTINPSGRVPYLVPDDGIGIEGTDTICKYLCAASKSSLWSYPNGDDGWTLRRLHSLAHSSLEGLSVWLRETHRPKNEQSPTIIEHERARAFRLLGGWERIITDPLMSGELNRAQVTLFCALSIEKFLPEFEWRNAHPALHAYMNRQAKRSSFIKTDETNF
jgi:glutathione S-transferase